MAGKALLLAGVTAAEVAGRGHKVELLDKGPALEVHDVEDALGVDGDFAGASAARQARFGCAIAADDAGVEIAKAVDLRSPQQSNFDQPALQIQAEQVGHG